MSEFYNLIEVAPYGDPWKSSYGGMNQTFFGKIEGIEESIMINKKQGNTPKLGANYGSLEVKEGKDYLKFNSEKIPEGTTIPQFSTPAPQAQSQPASEQYDMPAWFIPFGNMIEEIYSRGKAQSKDGEAPKLEFPEEPPLSDEEKEKLDDIFGPSEEVEVE